MDLTVKRQKVYRVDRRGDRAPGREEIEEIERSGAEIVSVDCDTEDQIIALASDADAIITTDARITRRVLESLHSLLVVVRYGIGYDTIDVQAATDNHVLVVNIPDYCFEEVSNHAMALLLSCARRLSFLSNQTRNGRWSAAAKTLAPMGPVNGEVLGLVGCGNIGRMVARKARVFGLRVVGFDPYVDRAVALEAGIRLVELDDLLSTSDYISTHTPLTSETRHMISDRQFGLMKRSACIINTARGPIVDEGALIRALAGGKIAGAGIDVMEAEPPLPANPLLSMDNVVVTPHAAYYSDESVIRLRRSVGSEAARVLSGRWPRNLVNEGVTPKRPLS